MCENHPRHPSNRLGAGSSDLGAHTGTDSFWLPNRKGTKKSRLTQHKHPLESNFDMADIDSGVATELKV